MKCIAESVKKSVQQARDKLGVENVLMVGGVSSSTFLREAFSDIPNVYFPEPALCTDNAVGVCEMGRQICDGWNKASDNDGRFSEGRTFDV